MCIATQIVSPSFRQGLPESRKQGCEKQLNEGTMWLKKTGSKSGIAIHGFFPF
jgi:hypothetical protein